MPDSRFDVSFVVPIFNKANELDYFLKSLADQEGDFEAEYIFVDDASSDGSVAVLRRATNRWPNVDVIENAENAGPAVRLNQGAARARGVCLVLVDPDEILAPDAVSVMRRLIDEHDADMVHGKWRKVDAPPAAVVARPIGARPRFVLSDHPLDTVLGRGFVKMTWLVRRALFERAGGCDERVFIQDESLPLRLALHARRFIDLAEPVTYVPVGESHLSRDKAQQHHDRFFACYNFLRDNRLLSGGQRRGLYRRCVSTAWKSVRSNAHAAGRLAVLARYLATRLGGDRPNMRVLEGLARYFDGLPGIRKPPPAGTDG